MDAVDTNCDSNTHRSGLQVPDLCDNACATAYLPVFTECHSVLETVAQQQGGRKAARVLAQFDQLGAACVAAQQNEVVIDTGGVQIAGATYFVGPDPQQLVANTELQAVDIPLDYDMGITIIPGSAPVTDWSSIIHVSASGENCCDYGDRIPALFFYPGTTRLTIRDGATDNGNVGCDPPDELAPGVPTTVRLEIRAQGITVYYNEVQKLVCPRLSRLAHAGARVWAADPFYDAANAQISNFYLVCDSDVSYI